MPTEVELKKRGYPKECRLCHGYGFLWTPAKYTGIPIRLSKESAMKGYRTKRCVTCGADPHPNGKM